MSKRSSSTQIGRPCSNGTVISRLRNRGIRCSRDATRSAHVGEAEAAAVVEERLALEDARASRRASASRRRSRCRKLASSAAEPVVGRASRARLRPGDSPVTRLLGLGSITWRRVLPDYAEFDDAIGLDWYAVDPNLRQLLDRLLADPATAPSPRSTSVAFGVLCGGDVARRAEITDHHPPVLVGRDRWGYEVGEIEHHPTWTENKADLVRAGFVGLPAHAGGPCPRSSPRRSPTS